RIAPIELSPPQATAAAASAAVRSAAAIGGQSIVVPLEPDAGDWESIDELIDLDNEQENPLEAMRRQARQLADYLRHRSQELQEQESKQQDREREIEEQLAAAQAW